MNCNNFIVEIQKKDAEISAAKKKLYNVLEKQSLHKGIAQALFVSGNIVIIILH